MERNIDLSSEEATIALTGIYADTGRYIHENVSSEDFEVSSFLLKKGASLKLIKSFLTTLKEDFQKDVLHELMNKVKFFDIQGHNVLLSYLDIESNTPGLAAVVEKVMEIENPDAYFAIFHIKKNNTALVIARSQKDRIDLHNILTEYGGGGHLKAGSAKVDAPDGPGFYDEFFTTLDKALTPALRASDIMTTEVFKIDQTISLLDASLYLEEIDHSGVPVVDDQDHAVGFLTLMDIMKGRRGKQMHAPVKAYMSRKLVTATLSTTIREIERIFYKYHIGHLPILKDQKIVGIVTRWDYLQFKRRKFIAPKNVT